MHRIDGPGHASNLFTEGNPLTGTPATVITDDWLNEVQEELISLLTAAGITPTKGELDQLVGAILLKTGGTMTGDLVLDKVGGQSNLVIRGQGEATIELGRIDGTGSTPVVDFHSGVTPTDYDARLKASGGTGTNGQGILEVIAAALHVNGLPVKSDANSPRYQSAEQTVTPATVLTLAHGLGVLPKNVWAVAVCKIAEHGYAIGDEVTLNMDSTTSANVGATVAADATNAYCVIGASGIGSYQRTGSPGAVTTFTNASWRIVVRADP